MSVCKPRPINFDLTKLPGIVQEYIPEVPVARWHYVDGGLDCHVFITGSSDTPVVFRFPRFDFIATKMLYEVRLLQKLREAVSLAIPNPLFVSEGCIEYPGPFFGYPLIRSVQLSRQVFLEVRSESIKLNMARQLGQFLSDLHSFDPSTALALGVDNDSDLTGITEFWDKLQHIEFPLLDTSQHGWTIRRFESFLNDGSIFVFTPVLIHGDLSDQHIRFDSIAGEIRGVIGIHGWGTF